MTPGQRAVACRRWRWMPGMLACLEGCRPIRITEINDAGNALQEAGWLPVLDDPATVGCLLALVREAWGDPRLVAMDQGDAGPRWTLVRWDEEWGTVDARPGHPITGLTEAEALIAALEAAP